MSLLADQQQQGERCIVLRPHAGAQACVTKRPPQTKPLYRCGRRLAAISLLMNEWGTLPSSPFGTAGVFANVSYLRTPYVFSRAARSSKTMLG